MKRRYKTLPDEKLLRRLNTSLPLLASWFAYSKSKRAERVPCFRQTLRECRADDFALVRQQLRALWEELDLRTRPNSRPIQ